MNHGAIGRIGVCLAVVGVAIACVREPADAPTEPQAPSKALSVATQGFESLAATEAAPAHPTRATSMVSADVRSSPRWQSVAWAGTLHTQMLLDDRWLRRNTDNSQCQRLQNLARRYARMLQGEYGVLTGRDPDRIASQVLVAGTECKPSPPLSLTGLVRIPQSHDEWTPADGDPATGAFERFLASIEEAVSSGRSPEQIGAAINEVVGSAAGIPEPDLQVVYGAAALALESVDYWHNYFASGGGGGSDGGPGCESGCVEPMSLFGLSRVAFVDWGFVATRDAGGCGAAALGRWYAAAGGPVGWKVLAGFCLLGGGIASVNAI
jgi:hypothetical protein